MDERQYQLVRQQFLTGEAQPGSILAKIVAEMTPEEIAKLRQKAAEGQLGLELEQRARVHRFQASTAEIDEFIGTVQRLERTMAGSPLSGYSAKGEFEGASGRTIITAKKGCFIATAVYGSNEHPNVEILRRFRDSHLEPFSAGARFCAWYYRVGPRLAVSPLTRGVLRRCVRKLLDLLCAVLRLGIGTRK